MIQTNEIKSSLQELLVELLCAMQDDASNSRVPLRAVSELNITGPNTFKFQDKLKPDYGIWLILLCIKVKNHSSFAVFCKAMDEHPEIGKQLNTMVGSTESQMRIDHDYVLRLFVSKYLEKTNTDAVFNQAAFDVVFQELIDCFQQLSFRTTYMAVLEHFDTDIDYLEVLPGIIIRKLSSGQIEELWNRSTAFQGYFRPFSSNSISPIQLKAVIETQIISMKLIGDQALKSPGNIVLPSKEARQRFELVLTALKLLKAGSVNFDPIHSNQANWLFQISSATSKLKNTYPLGATYFLSSSDIGELKKIAEALKTLGQCSNKSLEIALRRLGYATERINPEDKLIDAMIAFESMILSDVGAPQERGELRFRLSLRVAHLLGGDRNQMESNFKLMKKAYDLRSKVVHGDLLTPEENKNVDLTLELCRRSARELVMLHVDKKSPNWTQWQFE